MLRERHSNERGSASLEFITAGMLLLVPMVYLVLTMSALQAGALAVEGAARQAARVYVEAPSEAEAIARAERAVEFAFADHGLELADAAVSVTCHPRPDECLARRGIVTVVVGTRVPLPLVPPVLSVDAGAAVPLQASATQQVSRFAGAQ